MSPFTLSYFTAEYSSDSEEDEVIEDEFEISHETDESENSIEEVPLDDSEPEPTRASSERTIHRVSERLSSSIEEATVENPIEFDIAPINTIEEVSIAMSQLNAAMRHNDRRALNLAARMGSFLSRRRYLSNSTFGQRMGEVSSLIGRGRSWIYFLLDFYDIVCLYPSLLRVTVPLRYLQQNMRVIRQFRENDFLHEFWMHR